MSRKKNNSNEKNVKPSTKEEIEAAVNACYGNPRERITVEIPSIPSGEDEQVFTGVLPSIESKDESPCCEHVEKNGEDENTCLPPPPPTEEKCDCQCLCDECKCEGQNTEPTLNQFISDCANLKISAKDCRTWSGKSFDKSISDYLKGINKKIYNETQSGGYSTNVTIRVVQKDWVNVSHIIDWYKARGFEVLNYRMANSPMNLENGVIEHNFTISWAN